MEISFQSFCSSLNPPQKIADYLSVHWDELSAEVSEELPYYLTEDFFRRCYPHIHAPFSYDELRPWVLAVINLCRENPALNVLCQLIYGSAYHLPVAQAFGEWPDTLPILGEKYTGIFYFMLSLGAFPLIEATHKRLGLPSSYAQDILAWMGGTMLSYGEAHQHRPGRPGSFGWVRHYIDGILFRIGRLEYLLHSYIDWMPAVYEDSQGDIAVLSQDNWHYAENGLRTENPANSFFTTRLIEKDNILCGTPISPEGTIDPKVVRQLDMTVWHPIATPWDLCPSMHIPAGERLPFEEVLCSMKQAVVFFSEYLHRKIKFFCCCSWILNPYWEEVLQNSNIVRFRQEGYALPSPDWGKKNGIGFVFGNNDINLEEITAHNRMQEAIQKAARCNKLDVGAVFFMVDDIDKLGNKYYRTHFQGE